MRTRCTVALFLVVVLLCCCLSGVAETRNHQIEDIYHMENSRYSDALIIEKYNEEGELVYYLAAADGTPLTDVYDYISENPFNPLYEVEVLEPEDPVHCKGLITPDGSVLIPPVYVDTKIISDRWVAAFKVASSTSANYDYYAMVGTGYYLIDAIDIFYRGQLAGTLSRDEYIYAYGYGDYLCVQSRNGNYTFYNKSFEISPMKTNGSDEYEITYVDGTRVYYHQGSGVQAFCEGCPLTEEEVSACYMADGEIIYDLQGNVVCQLKEGCESYNTYPSRFAKVRLEDKYGIVDILTGEEVIPMEYDWNLDYYDSKDHNDGYAIVNKDGMFGYVRKGGETICDFVYPYDDVLKEGLISTVNDPEGGVIVITAIAGILPDKYQSIFADDDMRSFIAENADGQQAIIGLNGKELVPFGDYQYIYANNDATVAVTRDSEGGYLVWTMDYEDTIK